MKIFITGGTGYIGRQLVRELTARGHQVTILSRSVKMGSASSFVLQIFDQSRLLPDRSCPRQIRRGLK